MREASNDRSEEADVRYAKEQGWQSSSGKFPEQVKGQARDQAA
jgi:hypothetical protein